MSGSVCVQSLYKQRKNDESPCFGCERKYRFPSATPDEKREYLDRKNWDIWRIFEKTVILKNVCTQ